MSTSRTLDQHHQSASVNAWPCPSVRCDKIVACVNPSSVRSLAYPARPQEYEEITIPAPAAVPFRFDEALLPIDQMDPWGQRTFHVRVFGPHS